MNDTNDTSLDGPSSLEAIVTIYGKNLDELFDKVR